MNFLRIHCTFLDTLFRQCLRKPINEICETNIASFQHRIRIISLGISHHFVLKFFLLIGKGLFIFEKEFWSPGSSHIHGSHSDPESPVLFGTSRVENPWNIRVFGIPKISIISRIQRVNTGRRNGFRPLKRQKKSRKPGKSRLSGWCRWRGSNPHPVARTGFWVQHVCQFHHTGRHEKY